MNAVQRKLGRGITVADLIEALQGLPQNAAVVTVSDYGDYSHTQQALPIRSVDELDERAETVTTSAYSNSGLALVELQEGDEDTEESKGEAMRVVVLRT